LARLTGRPVLAAAGSAVGVAADAAGAPAKAAKPANARPAVGTATHRALRSFTVEPPSVGFRPTVVCDAVRSAVSDIRLSR